MMTFCLFFFFFFKQKTAYEMRISDWSSDVCSSDLVSGDPARYPGWWCADGAVRRRHAVGVGCGNRRGVAGLCHEPGDTAGRCQCTGSDHQPQSVHPDGRSEEHTSELQSLMRTSYAVFRLKKQLHLEKKNNLTKQITVTKVMYTPTTTQTNTNTTS